MTEDAKRNGAELAGKVALVGGSTAGIGHAIATAFLSAGAEGVMLNGRDADRGEAARAALADRFGADRVYLALGDGARGAAQDLVDATCDRFGRLDVLVASTGGEAMPALFHTLDPADIPDQVTSGFLGPILLARAALPVMAAAGGGSITTVASDAAKIATPGESVIGGVMAGIVMFTRGLAIEAKRANVRANCLTPSIVRDTPLYERLMADPFAGKLFIKAEAMAHLGVAEPEDLAALAVFLASDAARRITGQAISVNGGISAA
ncbi:MAG: SDR family oxidoreductase [Pseudomonadota bacterium]